MWLTENKEIIYKTFFITGSVALFAGLGNYAYTYYKKKYTDNSIYTNILNDMNDKNDKNNKNDMNDKNNKNDMNDNKEVTEVIVNTK